MDKFFYVKVLLLILDAEHDANALCLPIRKARAKTVIPLQRGLRAHL
jgi:hypothetical protein